jgi:hypothetical protein
MLSKASVNQMLKENFERQLKEPGSLPEDLATGYKNWVRGLVKAASQQIQAESQPMPAGEGV